MEKLRSLIPSFERDFIEFGEKIDKTEDKAWLYRDKLAWDKNHNPVLYPELIPADYMTGIEVNIDGQEYVSVSRTMEEGVKNVSLSVVDYGLFGNTHKYGTLHIPGVTWKNKETGCYRMSNVMDEMEPHARTSYEIDLYKIIAPEDFSQTLGDWDGYEPNEATQRFESLPELYCTAAYVSLLRVGGPFYVYIGESYVIPKKSDYLLVVDGDDNVEFCCELKWAIECMENNGN